MAVIILVSDAISLLALALKPIVTLIGTVCGAWSAVKPRFSSNKIELILNVLSIPSYRFIFVPYLWKSNRLTL